MGAFFFEKQIAVGVVPVIMRVDDVFDGFAGDGFDGFQKLRRRRHVDLRVDHGDGMIADDKRGIGDVAENINAVRDFLEFTVAARREGIAS